MSSNESYAKSGGFNEIDESDAILTQEEERLHAAARQPSGKHHKHQQNSKIDILETCGDEIVGLLQGAGGYPPVDVNARNAYDRTALHWAAGNNNITALRVLIQMGAQIDAKV